MKKNIIIIGDSFCASPEGWPLKLAKQLKLNLINFGDSGAHWWSQRNFLYNNVSLSDKQNAEVIIFVHSSMDRIPSLNNRIKGMERDKSGTELETAVSLYYKHIYDETFLSWVQDKWFDEINTEYTNGKIIHLHSFPSSIDKINLLNGMNVTPDLLSLSLAEVGASSPNDIPLETLNHLNDYNNEELASQLTQFINNYQPSSVVELNTTHFDIKTTSWFNNLWWNL